MTAARKSGLTTRDLAALDKAVSALPWIADGWTYLVGTAQTGGEYRDVDVRTIVPNDEFDRLFSDAALWSTVCFLAADWLSRQTGLPVDYQIQRQTEANEKHSGSRNPLGFRSAVYAGGGDATPFDVLGNRQAATA